MIFFSNVMIRYYWYLLVKKKVFNYSELHLSEMTCYKIHTLVQIRIVQFFLRPKNCTKQGTHFISFSKFPILSLLLLFKTGQVTIGHKTPVIWQSRSMGHICKYKQLFYNICNSFFH